MTLRTWLIFGLTVLVVAAAFLIPAMSRPVAYHDFADHRGVSGVDDFLDVASNGAFLVAGVYGLVVAPGRRARLEFAIECWPCVIIIFVGVTLTAAGSAYYHLVGGDTLKHLAAVAAGLAVGVMLTRRTLIEGNPGRVTQPAVPVVPDGAATVLGRSPPARWPARHERNVPAVTRSHANLKRISMRKRLRFLLALAVASCIPPAAAQTATITDSVNVRAGPEKFFPTVTWLLRGTSVTVEGCTANWRWCDVTAGRDRGWVYARFLSYPFNGTAVTVLRGGPDLGLPQIEFSLGPYWDAHFQGKRWFAQKAKFQRRWDQRPPPREWRAP